MMVQTHRISYDPDVTVTLYKGEHWLFTQLQRRKRVSKSFVTALKVWLALCEDHVTELAAEAL
jgi:hypothetical protein